MDVKAKILRELLQGGEKTTGDLCKALDYVDGKGTPRYSYIEDYLTALYPKYLTVSTSTKKTKGRPPKVYSVKYNPHTYREIWLNFPELLGPLMKSLPVTESIKKVYAEVYHLDEVTGPLFACALALIPTFFRWHLEVNPQVFEERMRKWYPVAGEGSYLSETVSAEPGSAFDHLVVGDHGRLIFLPDGKVLLSEQIIKFWIRMAAFNDLRSGELTDEAWEFVKGLEEVPDLVRSAKGEIADELNFERVRKNLIEIAPLFRSDLAEDIRKSVSAWKKLYSEGRRKEIGKRCRVLWGKYPGLETLMNELL